MQSISDWCVIRTGSPIPFKLGPQLTFPKANLLPKNAEFFPEYGMRRSFNPQDKTLDG